MRRITSFRLRLSYSNITSHVGCCWSDRRKSWIMTAFVLHIIIELCRLHNMLPELEPLLSYSPCIYTWPLKRTHSFFSSKENSLIWKQRYFWGRLIRWRISIHIWNYVGASPAVSLRKRKKNVNTDCIPAVCFKEKNRKILLVLVIIRIWPWKKNVTSILKVLCYCKSLHSFHWYQHYI